MTIATFADALLDVLIPPSPDDERMQTYALLDAARDERMYPAILRADCEWTCLYRGDAAVTMAEVAPYLVRLDRASQFTQWLIDEGWGNSWGVFLSAAVTLEIVRAHFRRFVFAQLPDGRNVYFRFYDPRVLRVYLPTCSPEEREMLFGPVERFLMEGADAAETLTFRLDG
jgi:hypothetical protein